MIIGKTRTNQPVESDAGFDAQVEEVATDLIESGEVDNAKPIYRHQLVLLKGQMGDENYTRLTCEVFNNSSSNITVNDLWNFVKSKENNRLLTGGVASNIQSLYLYNISVLSIQIVKATGNPLAFTKEEWNAYFESVSEIIDKIN